MKRFTGIGLLATAASLIAAQALAQPAYDLLLAGGFVFDGSGNPPSARTSASGATRWWRSAGSPGRKVTMPRARST